jgi:hypothetical protein
MSQQSPLVWHEIARERHAELLAEAEQQRLLNFIRARSHNARMPGDEQEQRNTADFIRERNSRSLITKISAQLAMKLR